MAARWREAAKVVLTHNRVPIDYSCCRAQSREFVRFRLQNSHHTVARIAHRGGGRSFHSTACTRASTSDGTPWSTKRPHHRLSPTAELRRYETILPMPERLVVIGDIHGDIDSFRSCLQMAGLVNSNDEWTGGQTVLVQLGDVFDRGDDDLLIEEWIYVLAEDAKRANGGVYSIMGNHEVMNAMGDHSMATRKAFMPFQHLQEDLDKMIGGDWTAVADFPSWARCRMLAMSPGGPTARLMAAHAVCMKVGDNLFAHAGILPKHIVGNITNSDVVPIDADAAMESINAAACEWMLGKAEVPVMVWGEDSPVWTREYSFPDSRDMSRSSRKQLEEVLHLTGTKRMFVGHTPQRAGINSAADGQVWRVDTGMTAMIGGKPEVIEIVGDEIRVLTEYRPLAATDRASRAPPIAAEPA